MEHHWRNLWQNNGLNVTVYDSRTDDLSDELKTAEVIVSATGVPGLITSQMIRLEAVVVDAGTTASEDGNIGR